MVGLARVFLTILAVSAVLLQDFFPPGPTWFKNHECCNRIKFVFTIIDFFLAVHGIEKSGKKHFSFKHASMILDKLFLVTFQVLAEIKSQHLPSPPYHKRESEDMEGGTANEDLTSSPGKSNIHIEW